jgi:hypothetical protein
MKKIFLAIAIVLMVSFSANAQRDGFFMSWDDVSNGLDQYNDFDNGLYRGGGPGLPGGHGGGDTPAPLSGGLIILGALGAGYAVAKRKREE